AERARKRQEQLDRERAERNKRAREQDEEPRGGPITSPDEMARRLAAQDRVRQERKAIEEAEKRDPINDPPPPMTIPTPDREPRGLYTIKDECEKAAAALEEAVRRVCSIEVSDEVHPDAPWRVTLA